MNRRAHEHPDALGFAHKLINHIVLDRIRCAAATLGCADGARLRVLDVGCGNAYLLRKLLAQGWDALGVDPCPRGDALEPPLRKYVVEGTIENVPDGPLDVVTAVEVLEHVDDYMGLLAAMFGRLRPNGCVIVTVPNGWDFSTVGSPDGMEPRYGHLWKFSKTGLEKDLSCCSDRVEAKSIYSRTLDHRLYRLTHFLPFTAAARLSRWLIGRHNDGAWLLGVASKTGDPHRKQGSAKPSAERYTGAREAGDRSGDIG